MLRGAQSPSPGALPPPPPPHQQQHSTALPTRSPAVEPLGDVKPGPRKRKAEAQDNERLSKRLSLLNLEKNGSKLYVPVESPSARARPAPPASARPEDDDGGEMMRVDDSKHKVYIYNMDEELSSDSESDDGRLVFLPDIDKHLKLNRIPRHVLANDDGELAGMQVVLYSDPRSLTVSEEKDGVRKAVIESRRRVRERQRLEREGRLPPEKPSAQESPAGNDPDAMELD